MSNNDPVAWVAFATDGSESSAVYSLYEQARAAADEWNWDVAPLYAGPTLTDEERKALVAAIRLLEHSTLASADRTRIGLLSIYGRLCETA
jgi:hypothetical protein